MPVHRFWLLAALVSLLATDAAYPHPVAAAELCPAEGALVVWHPWPSFTEVRLDESTMAVLRIVANAPTRHEERAYVH